MMQRYSSISKSQFSLLNYDDNHLKAKNVGIINKDISQSLVPSENTTIVCTICKTVNSNQERKCGYCDNTLLKIDKNTSNNSYTNIKDKYIIAKLDKNASNDDKYLQNFNSNLNLNKHQMNNLTRSSYLNQKEPWYCAYCRHLNKHVQNLCGKCHRDRTILNHNNIVKNGVDSMHNMNRGLNTNIENRFGISSTTNNNDLSSTKRGVTPVKKIDNVRFKDSTTEIGKRSLNNDSNGPIQNIERIFNRNPQTTSDYNYKPLINKDSNKKNIIVSNYNPNNMVKNPPLEIQRKYNNN